MKPNSGRRPQKPDWAYDPDRILEVALAHVELEAAFGDRLIERVAEWANETPQRRDRLRGLLKAQSAGRQELPAVEYAATLARYNDMKRKGMKSEVAITALAETMHTSEPNVERYLKKARKMLRDGELEQWAAVFR